MLSGDGNRLTLWSKIC